MLVSSLAASRREAAERFCFFVGGLMSSLYTRLGLSIVVKRVSQIENYLLSLSLSRLFVPRISDIDRGDS